MKAYHFVGEKLRDGRPIPPDGEWLEYKGKLEMCHSGLHASRHPFDALTYAHGNTICLVEVDGEIIEQEDKLVASRRKIIKRIDSKPLLCEFARWCALEVVHLWDAPDVVIKYLKTGDESIRDTARDAAWDTARAAAWDTARDATRAAARAKQRNKFLEMVEFVLSGAVDRENELTGGIFKVLNALPDL